MTGLAVTCQKFWHRMSLRCHLMTVSWRDGDFNFVLCCQKRRFFCQAEASSAFAFRTSYSVIERSFKFNFCIKILTGRRFFSFESLAHIFWYKNTVLSIMQRCIEYWCVMIYSLVYVHRKDELIFHWFISFHCSLLHSLWLWLHLL